MTKEYMVARDGEQFGPYEPSVLLDYMAQGHVVPEDYIWCAEMANWETMSSMKEQVEREVAQAAAIQSTAPAIVDLPLAAPTICDTPQADAPLSAGQTRQTEPAATSGAATPTILGGPLPAPTVLDTPQTNEPPSTAHDSYRQVRETAAAQSVAAATVLDTPLPAPTVLDALGVGYTGCPSHAVFLTSGKLLTKRWLRAAGLPTAEWFEEGDLQRLGDTPRPVTPGAWIVKGVWEHASVGLDEDSVLEASDTAPLREALDRLRGRVGGEAFVERFIDGREFNIALLGGGPDGPEVLPAAEIEFCGYTAERRKVVGFNAKWVEDSFAYTHTFRRYDFPASDAGLIGALGDLSCRCWREFDLRGYARLDVRVDGAGRPSVLEINANTCI